MTVKFHHKLVRGFKKGTGLHRRGVHLRTINSVSTSHSVGQNLVTWPQLTSRETRNWSLVIHPVEGNKDSDHNTLSLS